MRPCVRASVALPLRGRTASVGPSPRPVEETAQAVAGRLRSVTQDTERLSESQSPVVRGRLAASGALQSGPALARTGNSQGETSLLRWNEGTRGISLRGAHANRTRSVRVRGPSKEAQGLSPFPAAPAPPPAVHSLAPGRPSPGGGPGSTWGVGLGCWSGQGSLQHAPHPPPHPALPAGGSCPRTQWAACPPAPPLSPPHQPPPPPCSPARQSRPASAVGSSR